MTQHTRSLHPQALVAALALACVLPEALSAQLVPNARWQTIRTPHFSVHFTPELEEAARRAAVYAESAWVNLSAELVPPRGPLDLVIADNVDFSNGYATPFPTNRVVIYAHPPLDVPSLRFYDDWLELVITHELTHTFHLDRSRGWWRVAQSVFGRVPFFLPNTYAPAWVSEGLATYYESRLTGAGRVRGTHESMVVRASVLEHGVSRPDQLSLTTSRYPGGEAAYAYGSLFFEYLARTRGPDRVAEFVERSSRATVPFFLNRVARKSFGISFDRAWREWRDSLSAARGTRQVATGPGSGKRQAASEPLSGWRELTREGRLALYPRWRDSSHVVYAASTGKDIPGAYVVDTKGRSTRLGRRNGVDINVPLGGDSVLFSQLEFDGPYRIRSDLYVASGGDEDRLTHRSRVSQADARADGAIIAVRASPGTTQLVRVSADGKRIMPLVSASPDTQWAEPRWSGRGDRIAVTRWTRGGYADIVVLDTSGKVLHELTHDRAFDSSPAWTPDDSHIVFTSDRTGVSELYLAAARGTRHAASGTDREASAPEPRRLSRAATGIFYPDVSRDGRTLAASHFRVDGWHVGVAPLDTSKADVPLPASRFPLPDSIAASRFPLPAPGRSTSRKRRYSPWRSLVPRYWLPVIGETTTGEFSVGPLTSSVDLVGRHAYYVQALFDTRPGEEKGRAENELFASYSYRGFGLPVLGAIASLSWDRFGVFDNSRQPLGELQRRNRVVGMSASLLRPRMRSNAFATLAGELEWRDYVSAPDSLLPLIEDPFFRKQHVYRSTLLAAGWTNARRPALSISFEDGVALSAAWRLRWLDYEKGVNSSAISVASSGYKSLELGGWAHHVIAARVAGGYASGSAPGEFSVGGASGSLISLLPGVTIGERRTFGVRGFLAGTRSGSRAVAGSLEYRAPLAMPSRGYGWLPVFLDRMSVSAFGDVGAAWEPSIAGRATFQDTWIASAGAELNLDAALQYDIPYRLRFGLAVPAHGRSSTRVDPVSFYIRIGSSF